MLLNIFSGGSRGGARGARPPPLFWVKKEEMTEGKMAAMASKSRPGAPLSSRSGSATDLGNPFKYLFLCRKKHRFGITWGKIFKMFNFCSTEQELRKKIQAILEKYYFSPSSDMEYIFRVVNR